MKELEQIVAALEMLCRQWDSWHQKIRNCRQHTRWCANALVKFTQPEKAIPAAYLPPSELDSSRDTESLLSLQFSLLNLKRGET